METLDMLVWLRDHGTGGLGPRTWQLTTQPAVRWAHADPGCVHACGATADTLTLEDLASRRATVCNHCVAALHPARDEKFLLHTARLRLALEDLEARAATSELDAYPNLYAATLQHSWERHLLEQQFQSQRWPDHDPHLAAAAAVVRSAWQDAAAGPYDPDQLAQETIAYCARRLADRDTPYDPDRSRWETARDTAYAANVADTTTVVCRLVSYSLVRDSTPGSPRAAIVRHGVVSTPSRTSGGTEAFGRYPSVVARWLVASRDIGEIAALPLDVTDPGMDRTGWDTAATLTSDGWWDATGTMLDAEDAVRTAARL